MPSAFYDAVLSVWNQLARLFTTGSCVINLAIYDQGGDFHCVEAVGKYGRIRRAQRRGDCQRPKPVLLLKKSVNQVSTHNSIWKRWMNQVLDKLPMIRWKLGKIPLDSHREAQTSVTASAYQD